MNALVDYYEANYTCNIWCVLGNHENYRIIEGLPLIDNTFFAVSPHISYIKSGSVLDLKGKRCLVIGGADSIDKHLRQENLDWWKEEQISQEIVENAAAGHYDYVFSHAAPASISRECCIQVSPSVSERRLQEIMDKISFDYWYFGHYHIDEEIGVDKRFRCFLNSWKEIED